MRILSVRQGHEEQDIGSGRVILQGAIDHPSRTIVIVRRVGPEITRLADKVASRTDPFPWRDSVWVTDQRIFLPGQEAALFVAHDSAAAVILDRRDTPASWIEVGTTVPEIEEAILEVESL